MRQIKLLLTETIEGLGIVGDVVTVRSGYARNFLVPRGYVTQPTPENVASLAERRKQVEAELAKLRADRVKLFERLEGIELTLQRAANEQGVLYGGVSQHDIAQALRDEGYGLEDRHVRIGEQIKRLDSYMVPIQIESDLKTEIKVWIVSDRPMNLDEMAGDNAQAEAQPEPAAEPEPAQKPARGKGRKNAEA